MSFFFDTRAALEKIENQEGTPATSATSATQTPENRPHVAEVANVAAPRGQILKNGEAEQSPSHPPTDTPYGTSVGGRPLTWTGKIVSLAEWRELSEWEKHGPNGRVWNGQSKSWEVPT